MQVDAMDCYSYGLCSLGKRKSEVESQNGGKKQLTKQLALESRVANRSEEQTRQFRELLTQRLAHIEEMKQMLQAQLKEKESQLESLAEEKVIQEFLVACEMSGVKPDSAAAARFSKAKRKYVTAKRQQ